MLKRDGKQRKTVSLITHGESNGLILVWTMINRITGITQVSIRLGGSGREKRLRVSIDCIRLIFVIEKIRNGGSLGETHTDFGCDRTRTIGFCTPCCAYESAFDTLRVVQCKEPAS